MPQVSFYILPEQKKPLLFTCQLAQTVLAKSNDGLAIICPETGLLDLDEKLWSFCDTAFIPHRIFDPRQSDTPPLGVILTADSDFAARFDGVIINLTDMALLDFTGARLLEIIGGDEASKHVGREKYRHYQQQLKTAPQLWQLNAFTID